MKCLNCETEHNSKFCPNCGKPADAQQQEQQAPRAARYTQPQPKKKSGAFWVVFWVCLVVAVSLVGSLVFGNNDGIDTLSSALSEVSEAYASSATDLSESFSAAEAVTPEVSEIYTDDFKHDIRTILRHEEDKANGTITAAEAAGREFAYGFNLGTYESLYGVTSFRYRIYYRAVHGEEDYLREFGYNQEYIDDVTEYFAEFE